MNPSRQYLMSLILTVFSMTSNATRVEYIYPTIPTAILLLTSSQ
ncbi:MAG: hypothetical protein AVDCRST_MAG14-263 [uncultured Rubrobacteraceae bacterium]|uniref:Uncharacterized protein n=1 Tax=uncultured Rubrobacteraceae bacterium TaxID=349277 RepID=A0A6J4QQU1_9ACTN|nr:MAG: hypothetical protein AVDCRST_MAG14-263 [uncultured Rubrobacteraceae bacterium]